ncbi:PQQ-binding-like beta-propeller repeat protein [Paucibacter sp. APW11]|uniref:PQQ-binding-like beta-propeller repeat protein n=1 Tax=Roseateles aquae TaxID=3077235 RepID=A0ABU3PD12_9BURK|nr:PQQ-binding-like beta-propeller repeat protein [Paucibacter sp. APW11]MDT8999992.1 PQQ-binding-like beta-propeller repeat protein [Paucibacter sp. APW11]
MTTTTSLKPWLALACAIALSACGGGGSTPTPSKVELSTGIASLQGAYDQPQSLQLTVTNAGQAAVSNLNAKASDPMLLVVSDTCTGKTLAASSNCTVTYRVKGASAGQGAVNVTVQYTGDDGTGSKALSVPYNFGPSQWASTATWSNPLGNTSNSGYVPVVLDSANFKLAWEFAPDQADLYLQGVTSDQDRIYFTALDTRNLGFITWVYALSQQDGGLRWKDSSLPARYGGGAPAVVGGKVLVEGASDFVAKKNWIDAVTGVSQISEASLCGHKGVYSDPVIWDQGMYRYCGTFPSVSRTDIGPPPTWWNYFGVVGEYISPTGLAVDAQRVYVFDARGGQLTGLDRVTGQLAFQIKNEPSSGQLRYSPVLDEGSAHIFMGGDDAVSAMDLTQRSVLWTVSGYSGQPAYGNQTVYVKLMGEPASLGALDAKTGERLWSWVLPEVIVSNIVVTKTHVFVASAKNTYGLNIGRKTMDLVYPAGGAQLLLTNTGKLIIAGKHGRVSAIALH